MADYLDYVRDPGHGYVTVAFPAADGVELTVPAADGVELSSWTGAGR
jgi:hypothetical protein